MFALNSGNPQLIIKVKICIFLQWLFRSTDVCKTYTLSWKHIFGPTTLAAPLVILKGKWSSGHDLERPHLWRGGLVAENNINTSINTHLNYLRKNHNVLVFCLHDILIIYIIYTYTKQASSRWIKSTTDFLSGWSNKKKISPKHTYFI